MFLLSYLLYFTVYLLKWINANAEENNPFPTNSTLIPLVHLGGKSYYLGLQFKATQLEAMQFCQTINMRLVSILSAAQERPLFEYIRGATIRDHFWCSGTRAIDGKTWVWLSAGKQIEYTQWIPTQPDGANELCIELVPDEYDGLYWNDLSCSTQRYFICENLDGTTATIPSLQEQKPTNQPTPSPCCSTCNAARVAPPSPEPTVPCPDNPLLPQSPEPTVPCPDNPLLPEIALDGKIYRVSNVKVTAEKASQTCKVYGMKLFSITDAKKHEIFYSLVRLSGNSGSHWSSGKRQPYGSWTWENLQPFTYTKWSPKEPNNLKREPACLEVLSNGLWNDRGCYFEYFFICEDASVKQCKLQHVSCK